MHRLWIAIWLPALSAQVIPGRYIVELAPEHGLVRGRVESIGGRVRAHLNTVADAFLVEISDASAARLRTVPGVRRVHPVRFARLNLDHALPLHKIPEAWAAIGGAANAGAGVKIAIIDSGIDPAHPGFQDAALETPAGFPRANQLRDLAYTSNKVIVARNYVNLATPRDDFGHGTAVAMEAAGVANSGPLGIIAGVAPKAWLGSYKVYEDDTPFGEDTVLQAIEDAVNDGMDVINLSLGVSLAGRLADDPLVAAVERASARGVIVCVAAGNYGASPNTITSPATAPSAIAVGASYNDRAFAPGAVTVDGAISYYAIPGANAQAALQPVAAPLVDVSRFDPSGEACGPIAAQSLAASIALILRSAQTGPACSFADKLNYARNAGAVAAIVYMNPDSPGLVGMDVRGSTLPAVSIDYNAGAAIRGRLRDGAVTAAIQFTTSPLGQDPLRVAPFTSRGPDVNAAIKPDLTATGLFLYTATQKTNPDSPLYGATGYLKEADGTSFAAPLVAGAAALLKSARPGLGAAQYRSLLVNSAAHLDAAVQQAGAGLLDVAAALAGTLAVSPVSLSFGASSGTVDVARDLTLSNLGTTPVTCSLSSLPPLALSTNSVTIAPGGSTRVSARFTASALTPGEYQGYVRIRAAGAGVETVVPYWYGARDGVPHDVTELAAPPRAASGSLQDIYFRITDSAGMPVAAITPNVTATGLLGSVLGVASVDDLSPGVFHAMVMLGVLDGPNVFQIVAGPVRRQITIEGFSQ